LHFLRFMEAPLLRPWLHSAMLAFAVCMAVLVAVSLATPRAAEEKLATTTVTNWRLLLAGDGGGGWLRDYRPWLALLVLVAAGLWFAMR
jgi:hypothetical protein